MTRHRLVGGTAAVVLLVLLAGFAVAWYDSDQFIASKHPDPDTPETVLGVRSTPGGGAVVSLAESAASTRPGWYGLGWHGGAATVGDIVGRAPGRVDRVLVNGVWPTAGTPSAMSFTYGGTPRSAFGLDYSDVEVPTELGPAPAWLIPAPGSTWAITVHGSNANRNQGLQVVPPLHRLGLPVLDITYRNDRGAPPSPDGLLHIGDSEWRDLEAAVRTALSMGAKRVVLVGGSMGGSIVEHFLDRSPLADAVVAAVLDNPQLSVPRQLAHTARTHHIPPPLPWLAGRLIDLRTGTDVSGYDALRSPPRHRPPTLVLHGDADRAMPIEVSRELAATGPALGWPVRLVEFPGADHGQSWSSAPRRYEGAVAEFVAGVLAAAPGR